MDTGPCTRLCAVYAHSCNQHQKTGVRNGNEERQQVNMSPTYRILLLTKNCVRTYVTINFNNQERYYIEQHNRLTNRSQWTYPVNWRFGQVQIETRNYRKNGRSRDSQTNSTTIQLSSKGHHLQSSRYHQEQILSQQSTSSRVAKTIMGIIETRNLS